MNPVAQHATMAAAYSGDVDDALTVDGGRRTYRAIRKVLMEETQQAETPQDSLSDVFSSAELASAETAEPEAKGETAESTPEGEEKATDEVSQEDKVEQKREATPAPEDASENLVPLRAVMSERDKRQKLEAELAELRSKAEPVEPTSVFENEQQFRSELVNDVNLSLTNASLNQSQFFAEREFGKEVMAKKIEAFRGIVEQRPILAERFSQAISPFHELVDIVNEFEELDRMQNMDEYKDNLRKEIRAELEKELQGELQEEIEKDAKKRNAITPSLAKSGSAAGTEDTKDDSLTELFQGR
jgi:hypothetical protein